MAIPLLIVIGGLATLDTIIVFEKAGDWIFGEDEEVAVQYLDVSGMNIAFSESYLGFKDLRERAPEILAQAELRLAEDEAVLDAMPQGDPNLAAAAHNVGVSVERVEYAETLHFRAGQSMVNIAWTVLGVIGRVLNHVNARRKQIRIGEEGLAMFDNDLAKLGARYDNVYRKFFEDVRGQAGEGQATAPLPDASEWTDEDFALLEQRTIGPMLLWDVEQCKELWESNVPRCTGPDLMTAWSFANQLAPVAANQLKLTRSVFGFLDYKLDEFAEEMGEDLGVIWDALADGARKVWKTVKETAAKVITSKYFVIGGLVLLGAWALGRKK